MALVRFQTCSFEKLMGLYEANFVLLRSIIPNMVVLPRHCVSSVSRGEDLHLSIIERSKYTMNVKLTHRFNDGGELKLIPGLVLRIYFDARQVEVVSWRGNEKFARVDHAVFHRIPNVWAKWQVNFFLGKWLEYCLLIGHRFDACKFIQSAQKHTLIISCRPVQPV